MKTIFINNERHGTKECLVDEEDYVWIKDCSLHLNPNQKCKKFYVKCRSGKANERVHTSLHRLIFSKYNHLSESQILDHIDGNPLNNQKSNLRIATQSQNAINKSKRSGCLSIYKGVSKIRGKWISKIMKGGKDITVGTFSSERDAAIGYDIVAKLIFGEFAVLNIKETSAEDYNRVYQIVDHPRKKGNKDARSKYLGVYFHKRNKYWAFRINIKGTKKSIHNFGFKTDLEAAKARDRYIDDNQLLGYCAKSLVSRLSTLQNILV